MQRTDLDAEIGRLLGDKNHDRWTTDILHTREDLACIDILKWTNAIKQTNSYTPVAETSTVAVNAAVMDILQVALIKSDGTVKPLDGKNRDQLDWLRPNWENESSGEPDTWTFDASNSNIILVPKPSATYAITNALRVREVRQPSATMAAGSDSTVPFDSNSLFIPYHMAICYWVAGQCLKDDNTPESLQKSRYFRSNDLQKPGEYESEIKKILMKFDVPEAIPSQIIIQKQGGRIASNVPSKAYPFIP